MSPSNGWPNKAAREHFEIHGFIAHYAKLPHARRFEVISKGERPDYQLRCTDTGEEFGVELTSVYLSDRSVPEQHFRLLDARERTLHYPFNPEDHERYKERLLEAIEAKIHKAKAGYDLTRPLLLSIYLNEYTTLYLTLAELQQWANSHTEFFRNMAPFTEIVMWGLPNDGVFAIRANPA